MPAERTPPRATNAGGRETRLVLIRTAERLFAEHGIDAVSLRQISTAAGLRMAGAVAYHFGDKASLIRAIVDHRMEPMEARGRALLAEVERHERLDDLRAITESAIRPAVEQLGKTGHYFRFLAQLDRHPSMMSDLQAGDAFGTTRRIITFQDAAARRHLPPILAEHRRRMATHIVSSAMADLEAGTGRSEEVLVSDLIDCVVGLFATPSSPATTEAMAASLQAFAPRDGAHELPAATSPSPPTPSPPSANGAAPEPPVATTRPPRVTRPHRPRSPD